MNTANESDARPFYEEVTARIGEFVISSNVRPATDDEIEEAARLHLEGECPHNIVVDTEGWPYDLRSCYTCGKGLGHV